MSLLHRPFLHESTEQKESSSIGGFFWRLCKAAVRFFFLALCALATAWLFKAAYPKPSYSLLAWLALAPLALALTRLRSFWSSVWYGWLCGVLVYAGLYYWIYITCRYGGNLGQGLSLAAWIGLSALMAVQFAIFGGSCYYLKRLQWAFPILGAMGWTALEWAHEMLATYALGFPWVSLAYSQWNLPQVLQLASFTGAAGVSCAVAFCGLSVGYAFATPSLKRGVFQLLLAWLVFVGIHEFGAWTLSHQPVKTLLSLRAAVVQPNIDQYKKWSAQYEEEIMNTLAGLGEQLEGKNLTLAVWPESVTPGPAQEEPYSDLFVQTAQRSGAWQLAGTDRQENGWQYVSAVLFSPDGQKTAFYDKTHLVPFGEYIPFEKTVRKLLPGADVLNELGSFTPGAWEQPLLKLDQVPFGQAICYETVFSSLWRRQAHEGARFFVTMTNDAWFFDTDAPYQHLAAAVVRAVELRRPVLRAANTGISAVISARGEVLSRAELGTQAVLTAQVPLPLGPERSFYTQWGDWFAWLCAAIYFTILLSVVVFAYE